MNLEKHIDKATAIYKETYRKIDKWAVDRETEYEKVKQNSYKLTREAASDEHDAFVKKYDEKFKNILEVHNAELEKVFEAYNQEVHEFYRPNGEMIDMADKAILDSGILTTQELSEMVIKHRENPTMLRVINKHVNNNYKQFEDINYRISEVMKRAEMSGRKEERILKSYKDLMHAPIGMAQHDPIRTEAFINAAGKADEYTEKTKYDILAAKFVLTEEEQKKLDDYIAKSKNYQPINNI